MKTELIEKLEKLPDSLQKEVEDFVDFMIYKDQNREKSDPNLSLIYNNKEENGFLNTVNEPGFEKIKPKREAGKLKGKIWMSDDFDEPLEELSNQNSSTPKSGFGSGKGIFGKMSDDFDEPLDEMKEYM